MSADYEIYRPTDHPSPERPQASRSGDRYRACRTPARAWGACLLAGPVDLFVVASAISVAVWLMTGAGYVWPMWVVLGTGVPALLGVLGAARDRAVRRRGGTAG